VDSLSPDAASVLLMRHRGQKPLRRVSHTGSSGWSDPSLPGREVVVELGDTNASDALHDLKFRLPRLLRGSPGTLIVDLSEMTQPSSATVAALLWLKGRCRSRNVAVLLRKPSRRSLEMLRRTGLLRALPIEKPDARSETRDLAPSRAPRLVR
jgi:anti-anti-sigma regulatory factor